MKKLISCLLLALLWATPALCDTTTTHFGFTNPSIGNTTNWGLSLNSNFASIDTNLWNASGGLVVSVNAPSSSGSDITLTNPIDNTQLISFSATSKNLILPVMNATASMVPGGTIYVTNVGSNAFSILAQDGSTSVVSSIEAGATMGITLKSGATANGTFNVFGVVPSGGTALLSANNLSDVASASTARTNLGLGTIATQDATAVAITGGAIDGTTIGTSSPDAGAFTTLSASSTLGVTGNTTVGGTLGVTGVTTLAGGGTAVTLAPNNASNSIATTNYIDRGASGASWVLIGTATASNSATISFINLTQTYNRFEVIFDNVLPVTNGTPLYMRVSENNGSSYIASGSYSYAFITSTFGGTGQGGNGGDTGFGIGVNCSNASGNGVQGILHMSNLSSTTVYKQFLSDIWCLNSSTPTPQWIKVYGNYNGDTNAINAIQFFELSGNIASGTISIYGIRNQ